MTPSSQSCGERACLKHRPATVVVRKHRAGWRGATPLLVGGPTPCYNPGKLSHHGTRAIAVPSPGGEGRGLPRRSMAKAGEGELSVAEARGSHIALFPLRSHPPKPPRVSHCGSTLRLVLLRNLSTFPSAKIKNQNLIIPQCSRASDATPLKPVRKVTEGNQAQKNSRIFFSHFHRKSLANQAKTAPKTMRNNAKKRAFLDAFLPPQISHKSSGAPMLRTMDYGLWTADCELWTADCGLRTTACGAPMRYQAVPSVSRHEIFHAKTRKNPQIIGQFHKKRPEKLPKNTFNFWAKSSQSRQPQN